ncbi:MAG: hypothetical protein H0U74_07225 [Bradymonadaceae bacterium]|nr:hypothetical protein [Lujinxingiaceae bacterium]
MLRRYLVMVALPLALLACESGEPEGSSSVPTTDTASSDVVVDPQDVAEAEDDTPIPDASGVMGLSLMAKLPGLWTGPVTLTPLGSFPTMHMDMRPAGEGRQIVSRSDVDADNFLRFGFVVETHDGEDVLVYRNGGFFLGNLRDSRARLLEHDVDAQRWRFCSTVGGCDYIDATIHFESEDRLLFDVKVRKAPHMNWSGRRVETREAPEPFPASQEAVGAGDRPWPAMPSLQVDTTWTEPLAQETAVWLLLTANGCGLASCVFSRAISTVAATGATSATLNLEQLHPGRYEVMAFIDDNGNRQADRGELTNLPGRVVNVSNEGSTTTSVAISFRIP